MGQCKNNENLNSTASRTDDEKSMKNTFQYAELYLESRLRDMQSILSSNTVNNMKELAERSYKEFSDELERIRSLERKYLNGEQIPLKQSEDDGE